MSDIAQVFISTDTGAPVLSGQAGSLALLLDALLVDGYGSGITAKAPMGWTREFSATNKRVYRNDPILGSGRYLRLDDAAAQYGLLRGYESMTDIDTGVNPFPTLAQFANGAFWAKSTAANSTARPWFAVGTERSFYLFIDNTSAGLGSGSVPYFAGDFVSDAAGDLFNFAVAHHQLTAYTSGFVTINFGKAQQSALGSTVSATVSGLMAARNHSGATLSVPIACGYPELMDSGTYAAAMYGSGGAPYPLVVNSGLLTSRIRLVEAANVPRGVLPGVYVPLHPMPYSDQQVVTDILGFPPSTSLVAKNVRGSNNSAHQGQLLFDLTNPW